MRKYQCGGDPQSPFPVKKQPQAQQPQPPPPQQPQAQAQPQQQPRQQQSQQQRHQELTENRPPRIGSWQGSAFSELIVDGILLIRTDVVLGSYKHDISQWQNLSNVGSTYENVGPWDVNIRDATVLHYQLPSYNLPAAGDIFVLIIGIVAMMWHPFRFPTATMNVLIDAPSNTF